MAQLAASHFNDSLDVFERALRLLGDVSAKKLVRLGINRDLAGNEQKSVDLDGLGIRSDGFGAAIDRKSVV